MNIKTTKALILAAALLVPALGGLIGAALAQSGGKAPGGQIVPGAMQFCATGTVNADGTLAVAPCGSVTGAPSGATQVTSSSGNVAAAPAVATLAGVAGKTTFMCGFSMTSAGSTGAAVVNPTIAGTISGTMTRTYTSVAGTTLANLPLVETFSPCVSASAANTAIVVTLPSLGAGNTNATVSAWGYQL